MPKRVPVQSIVLFRPVGFPDNVAKDEKNVAQYVPPIGKPFEFTQAEIDDLMKRNPACLSTEAKVDLTTEEGRQLTQASTAAKVADSGPPTSERVGKGGTKSTDDV